MKQNREELGRMLKEMTAQTTHLTMGQYFQYAKKNNLSFSQMIILGRLYRVGDASVSEISSMLDISSSAVSQLLEKLVQAGYIGRHEDPEDRRRKYHSINDRGKEIVRLSFQAGSSWIDDLTSDLTDADSVEIFLCLEKLLEAIKKLNPPGNRGGCREEK